MSETAKVRELPNVMKYIQGKILDDGCGPDKIVPEAIGMDGRELPGVDVINSIDVDKGRFMPQRPPDNFDTIYSSHYLEHIPNDYSQVMLWHLILKKGGYLVLYLPDGRYYNHHNNPEHVHDYNYDNFLFWFRRCFCGEAKDFRGEHLPKYFELIDHGMDVGEDRYSFFIIAKAV